jgi:hypothetical protein
MQIPVESEGGGISDYCSVDLPFEKGGKVI